MNILSKLIFEYSDDLEHAYDLMKDVEPLQPAEYILKGVVNAAYGQEHNSVNEDIHQTIKSIHFLA
jgi:hypothetical protein